MDRPLTTEEQRVADAVAERRDEIVELLTTLIGFDTTARSPRDPARDEAALQEQLAERLRVAGADVDLWEPDPADLDGHPLLPDGLDFDGRPQLAATFAGSGRGRSLLLNGHVDAVSCEPRDAWTDDPLRAEVRDGNVYGRGACDMKGGIAAMTVAAEVLASQPDRLAGAIVVCTNTDEESSGAGGAACVAHGVRADGGIVTEPTGLETWIACRGSTYLRLRVPGRPGHAELRPVDWRDGGPVNAIEKTVPVLAAIARLRDRWLTQPDLQHEILGPPDVVPTLVRAGEWSVTYPAYADLTAAVTFLPSQADDDGWATDVEGEVEAALREAETDDPWLAENALGITFTTPVNPFELPADAPIVTCVSGASAAVGGSSVLSGLDSWYDGATFTLAGTPSVGFGPGDINLAHTVDEHVPIDDLVLCAQAIAVAALRWCGAA